MSDQKSRVTILSQLTAVSGIVSQPGKSHPFSVLDHAMGLHTLHIIFYYRYNPHNREKFFDLGSLRLSLAEVLSYYPPVIGRLRRNDIGNWEVKYNDAGVRILKATVDCSLDEWLESAGGNEEKDLTAWAELPQDPSVWSPFRIQILEVVKSSNES